METETLPPLATESNVKHRIGRIATAMGDKRKGVEREEKGEVREMRSAEENWPRPACV